MAPRLECSAWGNRGTEGVLWGWSSQRLCSEPQKAPVTLCLLNKSRQGMAEKIRLILLISFSKFCHLHGNELQRPVAALPDSPGTAPGCRVPGGTGRFLAFLLMLMRSMHALLTRPRVNTNAAYIPPINPCSRALSPLFLPSSVTRRSRQKARALQ